MARVIADISMSLDGFVTGPDPDLTHGLGRGGEALHRRAIESTDPVDAEALRSTTRLLVQQSVAASQFATHLTFAIPRGDA
jgi:hypothetical protein